MCSVHQYWGSHTSKRIWPQTAAPEVLCSRLLKKSRESISGQSVSSHLPQDYCCAGVLLLGAHVPRVACAEARATRWK